MVDDERVSALIVRWIPLLTLDVTWERVWRETILTMNSPATPIREFDEKSDQQTHIHFLAYEARWHRKVRKDNFIEAAIVNWPPDRNSRVVLIACDKAYPKILDKHVQILSNETLSHVGKQRHISRAFTTEILRSDTEVLLMQSLLEHGMVTVDYRLSSNLDLQYKAPQSEGPEHWDARGI
jgi:hypothetical protein